MRLNEVIDGISQVLCRVFLKPGCNDMTDSFTIKQECNTIHNVFLAYLGISKQRKVNKIANE